MMASGRSEERRAEVRVMDRIESAMRAVDDLSDRSQARVRAWVAEEFGSNGASPAAATPDQPPG